MVRRHGPQHEFSFRVKDWIGLDLFGEVGELGGGEGWQVDLGLGGSMDGIKVLGELAEFIIKGLETTQIFAQADVVAVIVNGAGDGPEVGSV